MKLMSMKVLFLGLFVVLAFGCDSKSSQERMIEAREASDTEYFMDYIEGLNEGSFMDFVVGVTYLYENCEFKYGMIDYEDARMLDDSEKENYTYNIENVYRIYFHSCWFRNRVEPDSMLSFLALKPYAMKASDGELDNVELLFDSACP